MNSEIDQFINEGILIEATHLGEEFGFRNRIFMSPAFWNSSTIERKWERVHEFIEVCYKGINRRIAASDIGREVRNVYSPPVIVSAAMYVLRSRRFGFVVVLTEPEEELDLRATPSPAGGSLYTQ